MKAFIHLLGISSHLNQDVLTTKIHPEPSWSPNFKQCKQLLMEAANMFFRPIPAQIWF